MLQNLNWICKVSFQFIFLNMFVNLLAYVCRVHKIKAKKNKNSVFYLTRSICLLMQAALPCLVYADGEVYLKLLGGTNADMATTKLTTLLWWVNINRTEILAQIHKMKVLTGRYVRGVASLRINPLIVGLFTCHKNPSAPSALPPSAKHFTASDALLFKGQR